MATQLSDMLHGPSFHRLLSTLSILLVLFSDFNIAARSAVSEFTALPARKRGTQSSAFSTPSASCASLDLDSPLIAEYTSTRLFSADQHDAYERDGFLVVSNLLDTQILQEIVAAGNDFLTQINKMESYFTSIEMGMIFQAGNQVNQTITRAFRNVALESFLPRAAAELMRLDASESVRVLRYVIVEKR